MTGLQITGCMIGWIAGLLTFPLALVFGLGLLIGSRHRRHDVYVEREDDQIVGDGAAPWTPAKYPSSRANVRVP